jgi:hypothetical protein
VPVIVTEAAVVAPDVGDVVGAGVEGGGSVGVAVAVGPEVGAIVGVTEGDVLDPPPPHPARAAAKAKPTVANAIL